MSLLRSNVLAAKARLAKGNEDLKRRHQAGCSGVEVCALATNLRDAVLLELVEAALADLGEAGPNGLLAEIALVAHGGHGRRDVAPYSDVDLMILHRRGAAARVARLAERLLRDVFDVGLILGHSVRTPWQACRLARKDSSICTSLMESRLLCGSERSLRGFSPPLPPPGELALGQPDGDDRGLAAAGAGPLRRDRLPPGAERQALGRRRCATCSCSAGSAWSATARPSPASCTSWACWARRTSRRSGGPGNSSSGSATSCTSTPARPPTC